MDVEVLKKQFVGKKYCKPGQEAAKDLQVLEFNLFLYLNGINMAFRFLSLLATVTLKLSVKDLEFYQKVV